MLEYKFPSIIQGFPTSHAAVAWDFLEFEKQMKNPNLVGRYLSILKVGSSSAFRIWLLVPALRAAGVGLIIGLLGAFGAYALMSREPLFSVTAGMIATALILAGLGRVTGPRLMRLISYRKTLQHVVLGLSMCCFGFALVRLHLHVFDRWFQRFGAIRRAKT